MSGRPRTGFRFFLIGLAVGLVTLAAACGDDEGDGGATSTPADESPGGGGEIGDVEVIGIWGGDPELPSFEAMVAPWESETGGSVNFTGTRDITSILTTRVSGGDPPDVAIPAEIGLFKQFASEGELTPLSDCPGLEEKVREEYPQSFIDLGTVDGTLYGFFMKADTKATVFYNPSFFTENGYEPLPDGSTFDDLLTLSDEIANGGVVPPWSMGQEAGAGSGFPGSDFIQQIILNEAGEETYDGLVDGTVTWSDPAVKDAWEKFGQIATTDGYTVQGSAEVINATNFQDAVFPPFQDPPTAAMVYLGAFAGGFITEQFPAAVAGEDFDFFTFPGGMVTGGANIAYAFNNDETTCSFLNDLASAETQQIWVELGGFTSLNSNVDLSSYPDDIARKAAEQLLDAEVFRFDLDDAIGGATQTAIFTGITSYLQDPSSLDSILQQIAAAQGQ
jgi:alpha-glucoside transport system substrate-binding protein